MESSLGRLGLSLALVLLASGTLAAQSGARLNEEEEDKLREAQEPGQRILAYLDFLQDRLSRFESFRHRPDDPKYNYAGYLDDLMGEYIAINEEMKNWIQYQYEHSGDMRGGLRALLDRGPQQLVTLRAIQSSPDPYTSKYGDSLRDAIDQLSDTLDGATRALAGQEKKFGELMKQEKEDKRLAKERAKEEAKRTKQEKKLRKRHEKGRVPGDTTDE
jgi:hypothetical protein